MHQAPTSVHFTIYHHTDYASTSTPLLSTCGSQIVFALSSGDNQFCALLWRYRLQLFSLSSFRGQACTQVYAHSRLLTIDTQRHNSIIAVPAGQCRRSNRPEYSAYCSFFADNRWRAAGAVKVNARTNGERTVTSHHERPPAVFKPASHQTLRLLNTTNHLLPECIFYAPAYYIFYLQPNHYSNPTSSLHYTL